MKRLFRLLVLGSLAAVGAPFGFAHGDSIDFTGTDTYSDGDITFISAAVYGTPTGIFKNFSTVSFDTFDYVDFTPSALYTASTSSGETVVFTVTTETYGTNTNGTLDINGTGTYSFAGPKGTLLGSATGSFQLDLGTGGRFLDVGGEVSAVPEPNALWILAMGLALGALWSPRRSGADGRIDRVAARF